MLLYALLFLVPLSGWWFDSVSGLRPLYWFNLFEIPHMAAPDPALKELARSKHELLFWILVVVAAGHAVMAFVHQFINRDGTLARMWPDWNRRTVASFAAATVASSEEIHHVEVSRAEPNPPPAARPADAANSDAPVDSGPRP
jgi:cytochrome b561